eukprot:1329174-Prymnesium_polylepis.1
MYHDYGRGTAVSSLHEQISTSARILGPAPRSRIAGPHGLARMADDLMTATSQDDVMTAMIINMSASVRQKRGQSLPSSTSGSRRHSVSRD